MDAMIKLYAMLDSEATNINISLIRKDMPIKLLTMPITIPLESLEAALEICTSRLVNNKNSKKVITNIIRVNMA